MGSGRRPSSRDCGRASTQDSVATAEAPVTLRLSDSELFHLRGPDGVEAISDETLNRRLDALEREAVRRGYQAAVSEEMLKHPEAI